MFLSFFLLFSIFFLLIHAGYSSGYRSCSYYSNGYNYDCCYYSTYMATSDYYCYSSACRSASSSNCRIDYGNPIITTDCSYWLNAANSGSSTTYISVSLSLYRALMAIGIILCIKLFIYMLYVIFRKLRQSKSSPVGPKNYSSQINNIRPYIIPQNMLFQLPNTQNQLMNNHNVSEVNQSGFTNNHPQTRNNGMTQVLNASESSMLHEEE